jgi:S-adenosylmethionine hydrolase
VQPIVCFVSDFGLEDAWVGVCHAVIHRRCPEARVVDLAHQIAPFDTRKAAAVAAAGVFQLPYAIHLVVVDPGVGGGRCDLCLVTESGVRLVGPDNGVLVPAAQRAGGVAYAYALDPARLDVGSPLATFHARDIFAPAAAALACGRAPAELGEPLDPGLLAPGPFALAQRDGDYLAAEVLEVDRFGSLRTSVTAEDVAGLDSPGTTLEMLIGHIMLSVPFGRTFSDVPKGEIVALVDSSGWLTLAESSGSAYERFGVEPGAHVRVRPIS